MRATTEPEDFSGSPTELRIYNFEPTALTPGDGTDQNAIIVIRLLFAGLVEFHRETGAPVNLIAQSITSADNKLWRVAIKPGFTFANGEPVISDSFIDAWNYAAYGPNNQGNNVFFERIAGYPDLQAVGTAPPRTTSLAGLRRLDDLHFEVTLTAPYSGFPAMVGYSAFFPMAKEDLKNIEKYRERPIGNGPYQLNAWEHRVKISLSRHDSWGGERAKTDLLTFRLYPTLEAGYAGFVAGECDLIENLPAAKYSEARSMFADNIYEQASNSFSYLGVPLYHQVFEHKLLRQALSLAIDRQAIIDTVFDSQYLPAESMISPNFLGYREGIGKHCQFDPERARRLLAEAGGWNGGTLRLHSNVGGGHEAWLACVAQDWKQHLGIHCELVVELPFADYFAQAKNKGYLGVFRRAWAPDYPWAESYLRPIFGRDGSANQQFYDNPDFDHLVVKGDNASSQAEGVKFYQQAEDIVLEDLPIIPLWFQKTSILYGKNVTTYVRNIINGSDYARIEVG